MLAASAPRESAYLWLLVLGRLLGVARSLLASVGLHGLAGLSLLLPIGLLLSGIRCLAIIAGRLLVVRVWRRLAGRAHLVHLHLLLLLHGVVGLRLLLLLAVARGARRHLALLLAAASIGWCGLVLS